MFSELFAYLRIFFGNKAGKDIQANTFYLSDTNNLNFVPWCPKVVPKMSFRCEIGFMFYTRGRNMVQK